MAELLYAYVKYCSLCDRYFPGEEARTEHVQLSLNHPKCAKCDRRFANKNSLRNHWVYSARHHYCAVCEREFRTAAGLRVHVEYAAVHRDDSDDDSDDDDSLGDSHAGWEDDIGSRIFPDEDEETAQDGDEADDHSGADEYWDEDDEIELEEVRDAYYGFSAVNRLSSNDVRSDGEEDTEMSDHMGPNRSQHDRASQPEASEKVDSVRVLFSCPLCLEPPKDSSATRCGHLFCTPCIKLALSQSKHCPVCRKSTTIRQLRKIYLLC